MASIRWKFEVTVLFRLERHEWTYLEYQARKHLSTLVTLLGNRDFPATANDVRFHILLRCVRHCFSILKRDFPPRLTSSRR